MNIESEVCRNTASIVHNLYESLKPKIKPNVDQYIKLQHTIYYYSGFLDIVQIRVGYSELATNPDGTWWLCVDPNSPKFKHLYLYTGNVGTEYADFNSYFVPAYAQQGYGTLDGSIMPK